MQPKADEVLIASYTKGPSGFGTQSVIANADVHL